MKTFKNITTILVCMTFWGCGLSHHIGNENLTPSKVATISKGRSNKSDVLAILGPPQTTIIGSSGQAQESWSYWSTNIEGSAVILPFYAETTTKGSNYIVTISFDNNGTVNNIQEMKVTH